MRDFLAELESLRGTSPGLVLATLVAARGGSPRPLGTRMLVDGAGHLHGSVSIGGCVDARLADHARRVLAQRRGERVTIRVEDDEAAALGLTCGAEFDLLLDPLAPSGADDVIDAWRGARDVVAAGCCAHVVRAAGGGAPKVLVGDADLRAHGVVDRDRPGAYASEDGRWFIERVAPPDTLVIVGATDVALALTALAPMLPMQSVVIDGRERPATAGRFAVPVHVGMPSDLVRPYLRPGTFLVLACHDYRYERPILREALRAPLPFVGMLSSRKRSAAMRALLREDGLSEAEVARLHAPVGLDIGGREPAHIALSIAAQIVAVREGRPLGRTAEAGELAAV